MREIKFRAWDKVDKRMIVDKQDFIPVAVTNMGVLRLNPHHEEMFWEFIPNERFELMQYTGIKDMRNCEVYEGDVLYDTRNITDSKTIRWEDEYSHFNTPIKKYCEKWYKIVGNIYENPELL